MRHALIALLLFVACGVSARHDEPALIDAARGGDAATVTRLVKAGADPNMRAGANDWPALLHAVHKHQLATAAALLDAGADPNRGYPYNYTPLMMAASYGHADMVRLLVARGADTRIVNADGDRALDLAYDGVLDLDGFTFLSCQDDAIRALRAADPRLQPNQFARRWGKMKGCSPSS